MQIVWLFNVSFFSAYSEYFFQHVGSLVFDHSSLSSPAKCSAHMTAYMTLLAPLLSLFYSVLDLYFKKKCPVLHQHFSAGLLDQYFFEQQKNAPPSSLLVSLLVKQLFVYERPKRNCTCFTKHFREKLLVYLNDI